MKKWLILGSTITMLVFVSIFTFAYYTVREPLKQGYEQAEQYVIKESILDEMNKITYYHGTKPFYVIHGIKDEEEIIVWLEQNDKKVVTRKAKEGITFEEARSRAKANLDIASIKNIRLGFERELPVYEIVFVDKDNRQGYYYITFDEGIFMKRYSLRRNDL